MNQRIVLASKSPRRKELIRTLGIEAEIIASEVDETVEAGLTPKEVVEELAGRKASSVEAPGSIVIGSDTIVVLDGEILGKPHDPDEARQMLHQLQGRTHEVFTGAACVRKSQHETEAAEVFRLGDIGQYRTVSQASDGQPAFIVGHVASKVTFRPMSEREIDAYVKTGDPLDKAGSYGIQGIGAVFIERMDGDFYSVMGLPLNLLYQMLLKMGVNPFTDRGTINR